MSLFLLITIYCGLIVAASLLGGWLPSIMRLSHTRMQLMMSGVGGLMLGVGVLHMLPHGLPQVGSLDWAVGALLAGIMTMFFLMRVFHAHEHVPVEAEYPVAAVEDHQEGGHQHCDHEHPAPIAHDHHHGHHHDHHHEPPGNRSTMRWLGIFLGLSLHTLIDGIALGAAVAATSSHLGEGFHLVGLGVFLGIVLHKPLDALSITFVMKSSNWPSSAINVVNLGYSLMCPLGVILFYASIMGLGDTRPMAIGIALCFAAGVFICIALADILPEIQFHSHDKVKLSIALLVGIALAVGIGFLEPPHDHPEDQQVSAPWLHGH